MTTIEQVLDTNDQAQAPTLLTPPASSPVTGEDNATDLLSYQFPDSTNIVIERYTKYIKLIHSIENFAEGYRLIAASTIKQYDSLNKSLTTGMPNFEVSGNDEDVTKVSGSAKLSSPVQNDAANDGTSIVTGDTGSPTDLNTFLAVMRKKLGDGYTRSMDFQTKVQTQILPSLKQLESEVEAKQKEYSSLSHAEQKDLGQLRNSSAKLSQVLDSAVQEFERGEQSRSRSDYKKDPYLVKKNLLRDAALQIKAENNRIEFLASGETSLRASEARILLELRRVFDLLTQFIDFNYGGTLHSFDTLRDVLNRVPEDLEWSNFVSRNKQYLITANANDETLTKTMSNLSVSSSPSARSSYAQAAVSDNPYKRNLENVTFRNNTHPSTRPTLEGVLARRETTLGLAGKFNSYYFVITPSGYFYGFPSRSIDSFQPNLVLYIPECESKIRNSASSGQFSFSLRGRDLSSLVPKPKKKYVFKASSAEDFDTWWKAISSYGNVVQPSSVLSSDGSDGE